MSTSSSPTLTSSVGESRGSIALPRLYRNAVVRTPAENPDSDEEACPQLPSHSVGGQRSSSRRGQRSGSRGRADKRRHSLDGKRLSAHGGGVSPRESSPYTPKKPTSSQGSARDVLKGSSSHERLYGPVPSRVPRLPAPGDEGDPSGLQSLWVEFM